MKLLFLTQTLDREDAVLGFVSRWIQGFAKHCESVRVVALDVGDTSDMPANVDWRELGRKGKIGRYLRYKKFLKEAFEQDGYDTVLAHMVPRYTLVASGPAKRAGVHEYLWYTHAGVDARLRKAVGLVRKVFTATEESLRVETPNKLVTGHGIDLEHFDHDLGPDEGPRRLLSVGRLTPRKDPISVLRALGTLVQEGMDLHLDLIGAGLTEADDGYAVEVAERIDSLGLKERVTLHGSVPYVKIAPYYQRATLVVNASLTGSLDKVTLEGMASRRPVISCNDTAPALFKELGDDAAALYFPAGDVETLTSHLREQLTKSQPERDALGAKLRDIVARDHEVDVLMARLVQEMGGVHA
jgi:glycosyltransferase involved in cell wall biosynthesis